MKLKPVLPIIALLGAVVAAPLTAAETSTLQAAVQQGPGHGPGHGPSGNFHSVIHSLFADHDQVNRSVETTETGYKAVTTSDNPEVAALLKKHVGQMESRLKSGMAVRRWDPAFAELREHYTDMTIKVTEVEKGVSVEVAGKTPEAVKVAQNHAKIVSGFVKKGDEQMHASHARALGDAPGEPGGAQVKMEKCSNCAGGGGGAGCQGGQCGAGGAGGGACCQKTE